MIKGVLYMFVNKLVFGTGDFSFLSKSSVVWVLFSTNCLGLRTYPRLQRSQGVPGRGDFACDFGLGRAPVPGASLTFFDFGLSGAL